MSDFNAHIRELYQEVIIDHNKCPRHCHAMTDATHQAEGFNPLCGDQITVYVKIHNNMIENISFEGKGCAISTASASLMTEALLNKNIPEAKKLFEFFHDSMINKNISDIPDNNELLGKLTALLGVREFPSRIKCATLAWHALLAALQGQSHQSVSTEL